VALASRFNSILATLRVPLGEAVRAAMGLMGPISHPAYQAFARIMPEGDQRVFADPEVEAMFVRDLVAANRHGFRGLFNDVVLFGRDWGFRLADVDVPVRWWHGDADPIVTFDDAKVAAARLPVAELILMPDGSHLGGFAAADDVLVFMRSHM